MVNNLWHSLSDPSVRHAMIVHIPIALGVLGVFPLLALAATRFSSRPLKLLCVGWFLVTSAGAALAANAGSQAEERVERGASPAANAALEQHEELGEAGWVWPLIPAGLLAFTLVPRRRLVVGAGALAIAGAAGVTIWVAYTGHTGGQLVYVHGLGAGQSAAVANTGPAVRGDADD